MKKWLVLFTLLIPALMDAQVKQPVKWVFSSKKIDAVTYELHLEASLDGGWHIYSNTTPIGGPLPAKIKLAPNPLVSAEGPVKELGKLEQKHEEVFDVDVRQYSGKVTFVQVVKLKGKVKTTVNGTIAFMTCNDKECLPPASQKFSIALN